MSKFIVSIGKLFEHGQLICAWSNYICIGNSVYFHAQNNSVGMRKPQQHYCMRKRFFAWAKSRLHAQNFAQARQHVGHTPKSFMAGNEALQAPAETANQLYYLQVLLKAIL